MRFRFRLFSLLFSLFVSSHLLSAEPQPLGNFDKHSDEYLNPSRFYFGADLISLHTFMSIPETLDAKIEINSFLKGIRFGYSFLKPDAFYFGMHMLLAGTEKGIDPCKHLDAETAWWLPIEKKGTSCKELPFFSNVEFRFGYTFPSEKQLSTLFLGVGSYAVNSFSFKNSSISQDDGFREITVYLAAGLRASHTFGESFELGMEMKLIGTLFDYSRYQCQELPGNHVEFLVRFREICKTTLGGEIAIPMIWHGEAKKWDVQIEPYYLQFNFDQDQKAYGLRFLLGHHF